MQWENREITDKIPRVKKGLAKIVLYSEIYVLSCLPVRLWATDVAAQPTEESPQRKEGQ